MKAAPKRTALSGFNAPPAKSPLKRVKERTPETSAATPRIFAHILILSPFNLSTWPCDFHCFTTRICGMRKILFALAALGTTVAHLSAADEGLTLRRDGHWLIIEGGQTPEIRINY